MKQLNNGDLIKTLLTTLILILTVFSLTSCDVANADWKKKYEEEKAAKEVVVAENDSLETFIGVLNENITILYNTSTAKIDSLKLVIATFPDTSEVIARYKIVRDGQITTMLVNVNDAVLNYINLINAK